MTKGNYLHVKNGVNADVPSDMSPCPTPTVNHCHCRDYDKL